MTVEYFVTKAGWLLAVIFGSRIMSKWRLDRSQREAQATPLVDAVLLEAAFAPRAADEDDADVLVEVRNTFLHLNRQAYAEEFWRLHEQLAPWHNQLPSDGQRATFRRALIRLLQADDRWLQMVAAKTCGDLGVHEAAPILRRLIDGSDAPSGESGPEGVEARFRGELEAALAALEAKALEPSGSSSESSL